MMISTLLFAVALSAFSTINAQLQVTLPTGPIVGHALKTFTSKSYYGFQGIPFAKPPVGQLRFQAPVPPDSWTATLKATEFSDFCYQMDSDSPQENEDCLYLNVFTPVLDASTNQNKVPVIFDLYAGAFRNGKANGLSPQYMLDEDIIVVTHNYRLGPFGFLATGDTVVPGNAGLKDQQLALKWTYENIHLFGGDPEKITIYGASAGSASVGYQLLSKNSAGLFRAAIAESGSPLNTWAYLDTPKEYALQLAQAINSNVPSNADSEYLLEILQAADAKAIDTASLQTKISQPAITVEPEHDGAFITEAMYESFASGNFNKVPVIIGLNSEERITIISNLASISNEASIYDTYPEVMVPSFFNTQTDTKVIGAAIKKVYVGDGDTFANHLGRVVRYDSDTMFTRGIIKQGKLMAPYTPVYFYQFSYDGVLGGFDQTIDDAEKVGHGEEVYYIWTPSALSKLNAADLLTHSRLVKMWASFVKDLNPTPSADATLGLPVWPQVTADTYSYLNIDASVTVETDPKGDYFKGWESVFDTYGTRPFVTY